MGCRVPSLRGERAERRRVPSLRGAVPKVEFLSLFGLPAPQKYEKSRH